ncbi:MAG: hypothetical protein RL106_1007 [Bacteroidota bacterium]|jgi:hypothetical protein
MQKFGIYLISCLIVVIGFSSCSTEVDLNAPYKSTTIVFGLLDPKASVQYFKINKTFLGDGNNLSYAAIRDSSEYQWNEFNEIVLEKRVNDIVVDTIHLSPIEVTKDPYGIFYAPYQTVYKANTPGGLSGNAEYRLVIDFHNRPDVEAKTNIVNASEVVFQIPQANYPLNLAAYNASTGGVTYQDNVTIKWTPASNVAKYDLTLRFKYLEEKYAEDEQITLVSRDTLYMDYYIGAFEAANLELLGGYLSASFGGEGFFSALKTRLTADPKIRRVIGHENNVSTRAKCFEVILGMANEELNTYLAVNSPVTGVIQERPTYSNITNGIGLMASRSQVIQKDVTLVGSGSQVGNLYAFGIGEYCAGLNFCDPDPTSDFSCGN